MNQLFPTGHTTYICLHREGLWRCAASLLLRSAMIACFVSMLTGCVAPRNALTVTDKLPPGSPKGYVEFYLASQYCPDTILIMDTRLAEAINTGAGEFATMSKVAFGCTLERGRERAAYPPGSYSFILACGSYDSPRHSWKHVVDVTVREGQVTPVRMEFKPISRERAGSLTTHRFTASVTVEDSLPLDQHQMRIARQDNDGKAPGK